MNEREAAEARGRAAHAEAVKAGQDLTDYREVIERHIAAAVAEEREACANVLEDRARHVEEKALEYRRQDRYERAADADLIMNELRRMAGMIRGRGEK